MPQIVGVRTTNQAITETTLIRYVGEQGLLLEPSEAPLVTFLMKLKKKMAAPSPRKEWFEDDFVARWGQNGTATVAASTSSTTITVTDGTQFTKGDVFIHPNAVSSSTAPEQIRVVSVSGDVLTVTRAFAGSTAQAINPSVALAILGTAHEEGASVPTAKTTTKVAKISYTEIFRKAVNLTNTQIASKIYGAPSGERKYQHEKLLKQLKIDINRQFLFGKASENLTTAPDGNPLRTTMGVNSVIATNVTNANGTLTRAAFESYARQAFRYGSQEKLLLACPLLISAIHDWGNAHLNVSPGEKVFGVNINRVLTGHGTWILVRDWMLEDGISGANGFSGWSFSLDMEELEYFYLEGNGENRDVRILENVVLSGADAKVDLAEAECGLCVRHEKKHAKLYNMTGYSA